MKKLNVLFIAVMVMVMALAVSCGSSGGSTAAVNPTAPDWVDEMPPEDAFWGIGIAKLQNESLAKSTATARARRDVASQLSVLVQGMLTDYAKESGTINNSTSLQAIESIGREVVNANLSGASANAQKRMPDGTWWVRVSLKKADAKGAVSDVIENEASRYADFKAQEALKMLDAQLDKTSSTPNKSPKDAD